MTKKYLIWVNFGGETGMPERYQGYYDICNGVTEINAVKEWATINGFSYSKIRQDNENWYCDGRKLSIIELIEDNGYEDWKTLQWV